MTGRIYHRDEQGKLEPMREEPFSQEDILQGLVADYPELLSGEQINPDNPPRWILIQREQGIATSIGGPDHWAVDHLLIDQDAILTLVEVKRSASPEIRRTIVGQMLEYAAHAHQTLDVGDIRKSFEDSRDATEQNPDDVLAELLGPGGESNAEEFWRRAETNLRAARFRLLFVADRIPDELARVVEFLNEQMPRVEALAVEIKQFRGETGQALAPRVIGRTAASATSTRRTRITRDEFLDQMPNPQVREAAERLMKIAEENGGFAYFGDTGISIRCAWPAPPFSVAWIYPFDDRNGWGRTRGFTFGMTNWGMDVKPVALIDTLENWTAQFENDTFVTNASSKDITAWAITHQAAVTHIDVLADRLETLLRNLQQLEAAEG